MVGTRKKEKNEEKKQLRTSAESLISQLPDPSPEPGGKSLLEVIHELRVHQIELEIQNEELKRTQKELELSRDRYQNLYDFTPAGYFTLTDKALITDVNLSGAALLGVVRLKLKNARFRKFVPPNQYYIWDPFFLSLLGRNEKQNCILRIKRSDGTLFDARIEGLRVETDVGGFVARIIVQDISDQREAAEKIRILADIADNAPASITVHDFDGNILYANEETFRLHGSSREEFLTLKLSDINGSESKLHIEERMQKILESGGAEFEVIHLRRDGSSFPLLVHAKIIPWYGRPALLSIATDLTEQKRVEQIRTESEERFRGLIRDIPDYILVHRKGIILFVNPAAAGALNYTPEEMVGASVLDFVIPESHPIVMVKMQERESGKEVPPFEITVRTKEEKPRITEVRGTPIQYEGEPASLIVLNDITERKHAEEALHEAVQKLHLLTGLTRHDILNQLTVVQLFHEMALETEDMKKVYEYIASAKETSEQIEATIGFTRIYQDFGTVSSRWLQVHPVVDSASIEVTLGKIRFQNRIPQGLEIYADPIISKAFSTLIENCIRHGGDAESLRFSCSQTEDFLNIICEDDGIGIPSEEKEFIFQNGYGKHTGVGLFLAREILSITGLSIRECGVPGKGARFEIKVPTGKFRRPDDESRSDKKLR
ncbi:MAG: hypothetical protein CVV33_00635 [Methanomicrobiales archaeon HGW-Methanomicrobiales-4]|nr:MAG: hypothetical protein CVV33_00635 [Methanomicrobiales archaeon HGW-Methanomicrobiales-4]